MSAYNYSSILSHVSYKKKPRKGLKIFMGVILSIVLIIGIFAAVNYKTVLLSFGVGTGKINSIKNIKKAFSNSKTLKNLKSSTDSSGNTVLTGTSKNKSVTYHITQKKSGKETVNAKVNINKLNDDKNINQHAIQSGNPAAIKKAEAEADKYLEPIVGKDQALGIEIYLAKELLKQSKVNYKSININHDFGDYTICVTGDLSKKLAIKIEK